MREDCEGCLKDWSSQKDHECVVKAQLLLTPALERAAANLCPEEFISAWAHKAYEEKIIVDSRPFQLFKKIQLFHLDSIKKDILTSY